MPDATVHHISQHHTYLINASLQATPFAAETDLIEAVLKNIQLFLKSDSVYTATEVQVGAGVVDLIAGKINENGLDNLIPYLEGVEACVLSNMHHRRGLKASTIAQRSNMSLQQTEVSLASLIEKGYCRSVGLCYVRNLPRVSDLIAIEGKLKDWRRALYQANRNRLFTSQSYVALDAKFARPALMNLSLFHQYRIGLAIIFQDGDSYIVYKPPRARPIADVMPIIAESALLKRLN